MRKVNREDVLRLSLLIFSILVMMVSNVNAGEMPGVVEGSGTHFEVHDSQYLNIVLDSSKPIDVIIESSPEMIAMDIIPISGTSTQINISGFTPQTTYHKYEDSYTNHVAFMTDANGNYTYIQDLSDIHTVYIQPTPSSYIIEGDTAGGECSSIGTWSFTSKTCTLTTNPTESIEVDGDNIVLDGNGHTMMGTNTGNGVLINEHNGITVKNLRIANFNRGIGITRSNNNNITNNTIYENQRAIRIFSGHNNLIYNNFFDNPFDDFLSDSTDNIWNVSKRDGNNIVGGIYIAGNFWDNPSRFSRTCTDSEGDGICDNSYNVNPGETGNIDHLPLAIYVSDTTPPTIPSGLTATAISTTRIDLSWTASTDNVGVRDYRIYRSLDNVNWIGIGTRTGTSFSDEGLTPDTTYYYRIVAYDTSNNPSAYSDVANAKTLKLPPSPPSSIDNLNNISYAQTYINWTWTDPTDSDFASVMVYIDGVRQLPDVLRDVQYFNATGLAADTDYEIGTHTVDTTGNINVTWKNHTARTAPVPIAPTITTFAITLPVGQTAMNFSGGRDSKLIEPTGQIIPTGPWAEMTNTGDIIQTFGIKTLVDNPTSIELYVSNNADMSGQIVVTTALTSPTGWTNVPPLGTVNLFARANFTSADTATNDITIST